MADIDTHAHDHAKYLSRDCHWFNQNPREFLKGMTLIKADIIDPFDTDGVKLVLSTLLVDLLGNSHLAQLIANT